MTGADAVRIAGWEKDGDLQRLLSALSTDGEEARVVGGAVRNALLDMPVTDFDIATTCPPDETVQRAEAAGFKAVPTGIEHGTVTVVASGRGFEVTTLRADVQTDGRHARVKFGRDWVRDAQRRDFTINALYADADGSIFDPIGGLPDIRNRLVRFIGDPEDRIREDYLRVLRFFRFFAWYGHGRPDAAGLKACARLKSGLGRLSGERVWSELKKLLSAPDPTRALLWMRQAGVLSDVLPESDKWGIDAIHGLIRLEAKRGWRPDPLLRLEAMVPPDVARLAQTADRLRMSKAEAERLRGWALAEASVPRDENVLARRLYREEPRGVMDRLALALSALQGAEDMDRMREAGRVGKLLDIAERWTKPAFPIRGSDLLELGVPAGPQLGALLRELEVAWIEADFTLDRSALLERAAERI